MVIILFYKIQAGCNRAIIFDRSGIGDNHLIGSILIRLKILNLTENRRTKKKRLLSVNYCLQIG
jgi:hypothetical protein